MMRTSQGWSGIGVGALIVALASIEPLLHGLITYAPPVGMAPSGLHTVDTYAYVSAMRHYQDDFFSPYACCHTPGGVRQPGLYALPHHHLYGILGMLGRALHLPPFLFLGLANGLGLGFMLAAAYILLRRIAPDRAALIFVIFALGGGLGGIGYVITGILGLHPHPKFAAAFARFFYYELNEGPRFFPHLLAARLYYTLALGVGYLALADLIRALRSAAHGAAIPAGLLLGLCAFLNFRVGPMLWAVGMIWVCVAPEAPWKYRARTTLAWTIGVVAGMVPAIFMMRMNPALMESVRVLGGTMWWLPFFYATALYWLFLPGALFRGFAPLPLWSRVCGYAGAGYVAAHAVLVMFYQAYYGNWCSGGDDSAARAVSDPALIGAVLGAAWALGRARFSGRSQKPPRLAADSAAERGALSWFALWFLAFLGLSIAALGRGWFGQWMPQRFMVVLGLPLAALCADGLCRWHAWRPRLARGLGACILACGVTSILVTWTTVHGPLGVASMQRYYSWTNYLFITGQDQRLLSRMDKGVVLAPSLGDPLFGDVAVALRPGIQTVYGNGAMDFSFEVMAAVRTRVAEFFRPGASDTARRTLVEDWCVNFVYCPDTVPVAAETLAELRQTPWLEEVAAEGRGALFKVKP